jgi:hypothetical protein
MFIPASSMSSIPGEDSSADLHPSFEQGVTVANVNPPVSP